MCPPLDREADDSTLPNQQQHSNVRLTSWWLYRSIWQTLGFTWTHRLCCNLSSVLTDATSVGKALCVWVCVQSCMYFCICVLFGLGSPRTGWKRQLLGSGWEPNKPVQAQQGSPFHSMHNNHPTPENTVPGLPCERTAVTVCRARGRDGSMCPFVSSDW